MVEVGGTIPTFANVNVGCLSSCDSEEIKILYGWPALPSDHTCVEERHLKKCEYAGCDKDNCERETQAE